MTASIFDPSLMLVPPSFVTSRTSHDRSGSTWRGGLTSISLPKRTTTGTTEVRRSRRRGCDLGPLGIGVDLGHQLLDLAREPHRIGPEIGPRCLRDFACRSCPLGVDPVLEEQWQQLDEASEPPS